MNATRESEDEYKYLMALNPTGEVYLKLGQIRKLVKHSKRQGVKRPLPMIV